MQNILKNAQLIFLGILLSGGGDNIAPIDLLPPPNMIHQSKPPSLNQLFCKQCLTKEYITLHSFSWRRNVLFIKEVPLSSVFFILQWVQRWSKQLTCLKLRATVFGCKNKGFVFLVTILNLWFQLFLQERYARSIYECIVWVSGPQSNSLSLINHRLTMTQSLFFITKPTLLLISYRDRLTLSRKTSLLQ